MRPVLVSLAALMVFALGGCNSAESRMIEGDRYFARGKYADALEHYKSAQRIDPALLGIDQKARSAEVKIYLQRGDDAVAQKEWETAERRYSEARRLDPASNEVDERLRQMNETRAGEHFRRGQELMGHGDPFSALPEFEQALTFQKDHPRAAEALDGARSQKLDREAKAETAFQAGLRARGTENLEDAIMYFTTALNVYPHHPTAARELEDVKVQFAEALMLEGDTEMSRNRWREAVELYRKAQTYHRRLPGLTQRLLRAQREEQANRLVKEGNQAFDTGDWRGAFERFSQVQQLSPDRKDFATRFDTARERLAADIYSQAEIAEREGRHQEAVEKYRSIDEFYVKFRDAHIRSDRLQVRLRTAERTYEAGVRAQEDRDLQSAGSQFRICDETIPGFRDVAERRKVVKEVLGRTQQLYESAVRSQSEGNLQQARKLFEECLSLVTPFRDASERLEEMRDRLVEQAEVEERYAEACRAQDAKDLERAHKLLVSCERSQPGYRDAPDRLREVEAALKTAYEVHGRAALSERQGVLKRALELYEESLSISKPCRDSEDRIRQIHATMETMRKARTDEHERKLTSAKKRYEQVLERYSISEARGSLARIDDTLAQLENVYQSLTDAQRKGKYSMALAYAIEINKKCVGFRDIERRIPHLQAEVDYAEGRDFEEKGQYEEAIRCYARCAERAEDFRDVKERLRICSDKKSVAGRGQSFNF